MKPSRKILAAAAALLIVIVAAFLILRPKHEAQAPAIATVAIPPAPDTLVIDKVVTKEEKKQATKSKAQVKQTPPKQQPVAPEKFNPNKYLVKSVKTRRNIVGKTVIEGTVTNSSSNMIFKDVVIDVTYLSKTDAHISSQRFVVYEVIQPGKKVPFKFKAKAPEGTKSFSSELIDAVVVK